MMYAESWLPFIILIRGTFLQVEEWKSRSIPLTL